MDDATREAILTALPTRRLKGMLREAARKGTAFDRATRTGLTLAELTAERKRRERVDYVPLSKSEDDTTSEGNTRR